MKLSVPQRRTFSTLIEDAEQMVELYWDTDNGQKLSRSLDSVRIAFAGLDAFHRPSPRRGAKARLIVEAQCSTCGPLNDHLPEGLSSVRLAMRHSSALGHVVILNGTTDLPEDAERLSTVDTRPSNSKPRLPGTAVTHGLPRQT